MFDDLLHACWMGDLSIVELLLSKGANVHAQDSDGRTPIIAASYGGYLSIVELLISKGANVNDRDSNGNTPILVASEKGYLSIVELLLSKGANIHDKDANILTPIMRAATRGHSSIVDLLLSYESACQSISWTLPMACGIGYMPAIEALIYTVEIDSNDISEGLCMAALNGRLSIVELLISRGVSIQRRDK